MLIERAILHRLPIGDIGRLYPFAAAAASRLIEGTHPMHELVRALDAEHILERAAVPTRDLRPGATVRVHFRIVEGRRERVQPFQGVIIRVRPGAADANFTVRRVGAHGVGVERTFPMNSPRLEAVEVLRQGHVRRANLYYLRELTGKSARLRERRRHRAPVGEAGPELEAGGDEA
jgi:large subunit ribosomal protein L19